MIDSFKTLLPTGLRPDFTTITAEGDRVAVEFDGNAVGANGIPYANQYCMVFTVRDGGIKQLNEYCCTLLADQMLLPLVEAMTPAARAGLIR